MVKNPKTCQLSLWTTPKAVCGGSIVIVPTSVPPKKLSECSYLLTYFTVISQLSLVEFQVLFIVFNRKVLDDFGDVNSSHWINWVSFWIWIQWLKLTPDSEINVGPTLIDFWLSSRPNLITRPNFSGPTFISCPRSISESRVVELGDNNDVKNLFLLFIFSFHS